MEGVRSVEGVVRRAMRRKLGDLVIVVGSEARVPVVVVSLVVHLVVAVVRVNRVRRRIRISILLRECFGLGEWKWSFDEGNRCFIMHVDFSKRHFLLLQKVPSCHMLQVSCNVEQERSSQVVAFFVRDTWICSESYVCLTLSLMDA